MTMPVPARPAAHRLPHRGDDGVAVPAGRGGAHRRHLRLHGAAAPRARGEAEGQRLPQREDRQDPRAAAGLRVRLLRPAGRHRGASWCARACRSPCSTSAAWTRSSPCCTRWRRWSARRQRGLALLRRHARAAARDRRGGARACRAGRACSSRNGTSRTSARSAGCRELVGIAGGDDCFPELARAAAGQGPHHRRRRRDRAAQPGHHRRLLVRQEVPPREGGGAAGLGAR